ncbi:ISNCY family transposase [Herbaspirillum sp. GCM10030257]|uniref:ISNCY family transposase n=1 Tax=Herbaspirillum sp. GCM10030257 TaxID=3273393 RepID=UPI00360AA4D1
MARIGMITMSMREFDRLKTIEAVAEGNLRAATAAIQLQMSKRQVNRLVSRYRAEGNTAVISHQRGQPGHRQLSPGLASMALSIIRERYSDFGPTLACEKLRERHGLVLSKETVRKLMTEAGLWIPRKLRSPSIYQPRNRRHCVGELIQIDGSDHRWFEDRAPACTLLVFIDDATSRLMHLHFTYSESTFSYFEAARAYLERHGKPQAFYSDKASIFRVNRKQVDKGHGVTQFGRVLYELNIESLCANTSQAKGRVERANLTLQDRLVKELRLEGISTMTAANAYAPSFIADYNRRFAKPPRNDWNAHRPVREDEDLDLIFTIREPRKVSHVLTLQYDKAIYLLGDTPVNRRLIGKYIEVYDYPDGRIELRANDYVLPYVRYDRLPDVDQGAIVENKRLGHVLQIAQLVQQQRDNRRSHSAPARTNLGLPVEKAKAAPGTKVQRKIDVQDLERAIGKSIH